MRTFVESLSMLGYLLLIGAVLSCGVIVAGCEPKEKVFDLETPAGGVEVHKSDDGVEVEVETKDDKAEVEIDPNGGESTPQ